jgi:hypothetical protein
MGTVMGSRGRRVIPISHTGIRTSRTVRRGRRVILISRMGIRTSRTVRRDLRVILISRMGIRTSRTVRRGRRVIPISHTGIRTSRLQLIAVLPVEGEAKQGTPRGLEGTLWVGSPTRRTFKVRRVGLPLVGVG